MKAVKAETSVAIGENGSIAVFMGRIKWALSKRILDSAADCDLPEHLDAVL